MAEHIVDLHIHSRFARATSPELTVPNIYKWCKIKGIDVIATGDYTHPEWFLELKDQLVPAENGLFKLKEDIAKEVDKELPESVRGREVHFILSVEISNIYTRYDSGRRLHNLVIMPSFEAASEFNSKLSAIGNLKSDGRPILGLDSRDLLEISLEVTPDSLFIPAHIWTPWFAMFGSKSGFDSIEEAFGDLAGEIKAVETGLSSDPFMNWRIKGLDGITLTSGSDAHSLPKMAREANLISGELSYENIVGAIKTNDKRFVGTIEFFPEEGKYHMDGHKKCGVSLMPSETKKLKGICPKCGQALTVGVQYRVDELADRPEDFKPKIHKKVEYIIPLAEMIAEVEGVKSTNSAKVQNKYEEMYRALGDEFSILRSVPIVEIRKKGFEKMAVAVDKLRKREVNVTAGYDGVYGIIKVFEGEEEIKRELGGQLGLLG